MEKKNKVIRKMQTRPRHFGISTGSLPFWAHHKRNSKLQASVVYVVRPSSNTRKSREMKCSNQGC